MEHSRKKELLKLLVEGLCTERGCALPSTNNVDELWEAFRALVNTRPPIPADESWLQAQDELLRGLIEESGVTHASETAASPAYFRIRIWKGDITTLATDAIVNAANSQMLGCWIPGHHCIDNAIHTFAGIQLRLECARIMEAQAHEEPPGSAKITAAYNLPCKRVIHTVGPIANGRPADLHRAQLASSYLSCLNLASEKGLSSIAFCCISTGVFGFPQTEAAEIAVKTVREWLNNSDSQTTVVFDVFSDRDHAIYADLLGIAPALSQGSSQTD